MARAGANLGRKMIGGAAGGVIGGPIGFVMGAAFADRILGFTGKVASSSGRLQTQILKTASGLLSGRAPITAVSATVNAARNAPVPYLPDEPVIKDPIKRIQQVRALAANPDAYKTKLRDHFGDLALLHPDVVEPLIDKATQQVVQLSLRAPMMYWNALGEPTGAPQQAMRRWLELENATHDVPGTLAAVAKGAATDTQIQGLRTMHPEVFGRLVAQLVADPEKLATRTRAQLRAIERIAGVPLTSGADPGFVARQQDAWSTHATQASSQGLQAPTETPAQRPGNPQ